MQRLRAENQALRQQQKPLPNLEAVRDSEALLAKRDRILAGLKVGKQAPEYKRSKALLDKLIVELGYHDGIS